MRVLREKPRYGVTLLIDGEGLFRVVVDGQQIFTSRVQAAAEIAFDEAVEPRARSTRDLRAREQAHFAAQAIAASAAKQKATAARRSGGKGGKGGV